MGDCDCGGCCCCLCEGIPCKDLGNCKNCQCEPCRNFINDNRGLCCCQDDPVQCCGCLEDFWREKCPTGRVFDWCVARDCPQCCASCSQCALCGVCTGYYCHCDCDDSGGMDAAPWPLFKERGFRIGRMTDCDHPYMNGEVECLTCVAAWTLCWPCTVGSLLAHSRNPINQPVKRPHCGHGIAAVLGCPCSMCIIRNNLRLRHDHEQAKCAVCRDGFACLCCCPCMVAQFSRATFPWEWVPCEPVPAHLQVVHAAPSTNGAEDAVTGTVVGDPSAPAEKAGFRDDVPADIERFESVEIDEGDTHPFHSNQYRRRSSGGNESPRDSRVSAPCATPDLPGSMR